MRERTHCHSTPAAQPVNQPSWTNDSAGCALAACKQLPFWSGIEISDECAFRSSLMSTAWLAGLSWGSVFIWHVYMGRLSVLRCHIACTGHPPLAQAPANIFCWADMSRYAMASVLIEQNSKGRSGSRAWHACQLGCFAMQVVHMQGMCTS